MYTMEDIFVCYARLPEGKIPYMDREFEKLKLRLNEPEIEWKLEATNFYDGTPVIYLDGRNRDYTEQDIQRIVKKIKKENLLGKWNNIHRPPSQLDKMISD